MRYMRILIFENRFCGFEFLMLVGSTERREPDVSVQWLTASAGLGRCPVASRLPADSKR
jgi:hypothetical protein